VCVCVWMLDDVGTMIKNLILFTCIQK